VRIRNRVTFNAATLTSSAVPSKLLLALVRRSVLRARPGERDKRFGGDDTGFAVRRQE